MHGYHTRQSKNSELGRLQRRSRYYTVRPTIYQPQETDATRATAPLPLPPRARQGADFPKMNARRATVSLTQRQEVMRGTDPLLPRMSAIRNRASLPVRNGTSEGKNDTSLRYYLVRLALGIWKLLESTPPRPRFACAFLFIAVLFVLSSIVNALLQIIAPLATPVYIISGIIASFIVIYEFVIKK